MSENERAKSFEKDIIVEDQMVENEKGASPIRNNSGRETESQSVKVEEEECRSESLAPSKSLQVTGHSSSTDYEPSNFVSCNEKITNTNFYYEKDTDSPLSLNRDPSWITPGSSRSVSPISSKSSVYNSTESSTDLYISSRNVSLDCFSPCPEIHQPLNDPMDIDDLSNQTVVNPNLFNYTVSIPRPLNDPINIDDSSNQTVVNPNLCNYTVSIPRPLNDTIDIDDLSNQTVVNPYLCNYTVFNEELPCSNSLKRHFYSVTVNTGKGMTNTESSSLCKCSNNPDKSVPAPENEMTGNGPQTNEYVDNENLNEDSVNSKESQLLQRNPANGPQTNEYVNSENLNEDSVNSKESQLLQGNPALRQFHLLDELDASDREEGEALESNSWESCSEFNEEVPLDDVDKMLDEGLPEKFKSSKNKEFPLKLRQKVVLEEIGHDHFDLLPEGWIQIIHSCGMPVYLNKKSRVCTMTRPYYLGPGSSRNHDIPLTAVPCLHYKRATEMEKKNQEEREKQLEQCQSSTEIELMSAKIETCEENKATQSLKASELQEYCKKIFKFKTVNLLPFRSWSDKRKYTKMKKDMLKKQRPTLPKGTKLLKFPIKNPDGNFSKSKGEWIINPNGKSYVCILHEYVQHALKKHPKYEFKELENPATPYSATVFIDDMKYGFGIGASKKQAKVEAAKAALEVLIPGIKDKIELDSRSGKRTGPTKKNSDTDISIFDQIEVEDTRVAEFCAKSTEPPPFVILMTCLKRNAGICEVKIDYKMSLKNFKRDELTMTVGNHKAVVACRNKREGKQRAAQAILKALHPNITFWGSLLRMYGNRSIEGSIKEKKQEEQDITQLQSQAVLNQPNFAILDKLRTELLKLKEKREAVKAKGQFILPENILLPSLSSTDLNKVNIEKIELKVCD